MTLMKIHRSGLTLNKTLKDAEFSVNQRKYQRISASILLSVVFFLAFSVYAEEKQWSGGGDATYWKDEDNWSPAAVPTAADNATISKESASVYADETFNANELTVGGRGSAAFSSENFVYGEISPDAATDIALYIRKDGEVTLKGAGTLTLKGAFKNSQETLTSEPGFMFGVE